MAFQTACARHIASLQDTESCRAFVGPCGIFVEPLWNLRGTLSVEPYLKAAPDHPAALAEPRAGTFDGGASHSSGTGRPGDSDGPRLAAALSRALGWWGPPKGFPTKMIKSKMAPFFQQIV